MNMSLLVTVELSEEPFYALYAKRRMFVYSMVTNKFFDMAVSLIIFLNVISMAVEHYRMSQVRTLIIVMQQPVTTLMPSCQSAVAAGVAPAM